ncbi:MAG: HAD hydrolase-like protein [Rhodospirillales bacterium]|jgi:phosphoglycolate phosphatase-like HAD superfamily hydrolase|nr:HAD hydrolase-like protein [Rhodospirillales bacterium]
MTGPNQTQAVIFDFDGVIVESADIKTAAFRALYRPHGAAVEAAAVAHHLANGGISRRKKIRHIHREHLGISLDQAELDRLCALFSSLVEDAVVAAPAVPGALPLLAHLAERAPRFVVSGTPEPELKRIVARRGLTDMFTEVHGSPREKPPIIRDLLARYGLAPAAVLFIGDALTDWRAAKETGVRFVGRAADGAENPFPAGVTVIADLTELPL